jgi:hypothetical protein
MAAAPGPDGHHDDLDQDELAGLALLVPDDARSLDADRLAYYRELRERARGGPSVVARVRRSLSSGVAGPIVLVLLVVVGLFGSTLGMFGGSIPVTSPALPLATAPAAAPGQEGGLLPDIQVTVDTERADLRDARPAVIALVPDDCPDCRDTLRSLAGQAHEYGLQMLLIGPSQQEGQLDDVDSTALGGWATVVVDIGNVMRPTYNPSGVTALLVASDGIVESVVPDVTSTTRLEPQLSQVVRPPSAASR